MPLTPSETRKLLDHLGHRPQKKLGQNFLVDGNLVKKSISLANPESTQQVLEIGPGLGTLTNELLNCGVVVHAVEIDPTLVTYLLQKFSGPITEKKLFLSEVDAVKKPTGFHLPPGCDFQVIANLPYAISSPWFESILNCPTLPKSLTLMLQKEASDRMWAKPGTKNYNALSIFLQASYQLKNSHAVSRQCFHPIPAVDSVLIHMERLEKPFIFPEKTRKLIRKIFTKRRKQMGAITKQEAGEVAHLLEKWMNEINLPRDSRPEQIVSSDWQRLSQMLQD